MTDETPTPEPTTQDTEAHGRRRDPVDESEDVEAHGNMRNANEPLDEDTEAHARINGNANEPVDEDADDVEGHSPKRRV
jgi:hypothetical protein